MPLTPKQQRFVEEYLVDPNATDAARRAGYSERTAGVIGHENLKKPEIQSAIDKARVERSARTRITQDYVLENLLEVVERCMQRAPVMRPTGEQVMEDGKHVWKFEAKNVIAALDKMCRHLGMYNDKVEHSGTVTEVHVYIPEKDQLESAHPS